MPKTYYIAVLSENEFIYILIKNLIINHMKKPFTHKNNFYKQLKLHLIKILKYFILGFQKAIMT
jgi:hypothetical protein